MDGHWAADADGKPLAVLKCKYLPEGAHVQPCLAGLLRVFVPVSDALHDRRGAFAQAAESIVAAILGLHEDRVSEILHAVADLALDADVGHFPVAVIVGR